MSIQRFPYTPMPPYAGGMPIIKVGLVHEEYSCDTLALVDSGAAMNVLPFEYGEQLGFVWNEQRLALPMGGLLPDAKAFAVPVILACEPFPPIELAFAWTNVPNTKLRVLLGQINFFQHFTVTFRAYEQHFEIASKLS
ncbi:hypothetical protein QUF75_13480 [Desulfococcaceae bacterium HSG7]|nr:hypothetical protein [Desulfococcaceae bacterium HSG7]